jgi:hypothetical protein
MISRGIFGRCGPISGQLRRLCVASAGILIAASGVVVGAGVVPAGAASLSVFWVAPAGVTGAANTSCTSAAYDTIQSAITAAEALVATPAVDKSIKVCPGTYSEQLTITSSLSIVRAPVAANAGPVVVQLPASVGANQTLGLSTTNCQAGDSSVLPMAIQAPQSVVEICSAKTGGINATGVDVDMTGLTIQGNWPTTVCYDSLYDVLVGGGATLALADSTIEQAGAYPLNGCQGGVGVQVGFSPTAQIGHASLTGDVIETYQKNGVTIDGSGSTATLSDLTVTGDGPTSMIAQNGIQISYGATGTVSRSTITGNNYTGAGVASSTGVLVLGGCGGPSVVNATVSDNKLVNNDVGIFMGNFASAASCAAVSSTPSNDKALSNTISNASGYPGGVASADANVSGDGPSIGYQAGIEDCGNHDSLTGNLISGVGYAPLGDPTNPTPPAVVLPIDVVSCPAVHPVVSANKYGTQPYNPGGPTSPGFPGFPDPL